MLRFSLYEVLPGSSVFADFYEEPEPKKWLLFDFLNDMYGQEDLYLAEIAKAEAGEPADIYNHSIHAYFYPDYAVLEDMNDPDLQDPAAAGPRRCIRLPLPEAKQLILDWLEAKRRWFQQPISAADKSPLPSASPAHGQTGGGPAP
ncbi:MAG TPA: hypothetical protein PLW65_07685, partial [Pseudomonadota bacterium]|nr:hypothetical protein [Pseudomonadota bacterium]